MLHLLHKPNTSPLWYDGSAKSSNLLTHGNTPLVDRLVAFCTSTTGGLGKNGIAEGLSKIEGSTAGVHAMSSTSGKCR